MFAQRAASRDGRLPHMAPETRQIVFINAAHTLTHYSLVILATAVLGIVVQSPEAFGADYGPVLALGTGMFVLYGLGSLPQGWLAERFGRVAMVRAFFLGAGLSLLAAGLSMGPEMLAVSLLCLGAFLAIYHPICTAMLVEAAGRRVGRAVGINGVFGNLGVALAPVATAVLVAWIGWRAAFLVPGAIALVLGLLYWREPPFDTSAGQKAAGPFPAIPRAIVRRAVIVLLAIAAASGLVFNAFTLLLPKLLEERLAADPGLLPLVGALAFAATLCGGLAQFTVGHWIDRATLRRVFLPLAAVQAPGLVALALLEGWVLVPIAGIVAASVFGQVTVNETMTARYVAPALRAKLYSVRFTVGFLGAALASPLIGWLHAATGGMTALLLVLAAFGLIVLACALAFPDREEELHPERWALAAAE
jgi:MFS family permease